MKAESLWYIFCRFRATSNFCSLNYFEQCSVISSSTCEQEWNILIKCLILSLDIPLRLNDEGQHILDVQCLSLLAFFLDNTIFQIKRLLFKRWNLSLFHWKINHRWVLCVAILKYCIESSETGNLRTITTLGTFMLSKSHVRGVNI